MEQRQQLNSVLGKMAELVQWLTIKTISIVITCYKYYDKLPEGRCNVDPVTIPPNRYRKRRSSGVGYALFFSDIVSTTVIYGPFVIVMTPSNGWRHGDGVAASLDRRMIFFVGEDQPRCLSLGLIIEWFKNNHYWYGSFQKWGVIS